MSSSSLSVSSPRSSSSTSSRNGALDTGDQRLPQQQQQPQQESSSRVRRLFSSPRRNKAVPQQPSSSPETSDHRRLPRSVRRCVRSPRRGSPPTVPQSPPMRMMHIDSTNPAEDDDDDVEIVVTASSSSESASSTSTPTAVAVSSHSAPLLLQQQQPQQQQQHQETIIVESEQDRIRREEEESIALARMLMAQEALESYARSAELLRQNAQQYSAEDYQALQAALQEEEGNGDDDDDSSSGNNSNRSAGDWSYDTMLRLGETLGDVKRERWALIAQSEIDKLEEYVFVGSNSDDKLGPQADDDSCAKCLICQFAYEKAERIRKLPCAHCFHSECVDAWLMERDSCPYCRTSLMPN